MIEWVGAFASGLADGIFWPFIVLSVIAVIAGLIGAIYHFDSPYASGERATANTLFVGAIHSLIFMWGSWAVLNAIPEPNYTVKTKVVEVVKEVTVASKFEDVYQSCMYDSTRYFTVDDEDEKQIIDKCTSISRELVQGRLAPKEERYRVLFNTCMGGDIQEGGWSVGNDDNLNSGAPLRQERIKLCHQQVKEVIQ